MPWKESSVMEERLCFVGRLLDGETMTERLPGVRYIPQYRLQDFRPLQGARARGLDRSLTAARCATPTSSAADREPDRASSAEKPHWGARKIRELLVRRLCRRYQSSRQKHHPRRARSSRPGQARGGPRHRAHGTPLSEGPRPTICGAPTSRVSSSSVTAAIAIRSPSPTTPRASCCSARRCESVREETAFTAFERLFRERGMPLAIRSDNGVPFASPNALFNLSKLSVWWLRLGIAIERIKPGRPQQNGRHERMHLTLKKEATRPADMNSLQQQAQFDASCTSSIPSVRTKRSR